MPPPYPVLSVLILAACSNEPIAHAPDADPASLALSYGGAYLADFDYSDTGPSTVVLTPERHTARSKSGLTDPAHVMFVDADTAAFIAALPAGDPTLEVYTARALATHTDPPIGHDIHVAMASGTLVTEADFQALRQAWALDRAAALAPDIASTRSTVVAAGGSIIEEGTLLPYVVFEADQPTISSLVASGAFDSLAWAAPAYRNHVPPTGNDLREWTLTEYFSEVGTDLNSDGVTEFYRGQSSRVAVIEMFAMDSIGHPGFFSMAPLSGSTTPRGPRLVDAFACQVSRTSTNCGTSVTHPGHWRAPTGRNFHGMTVASVLLGDTMAGQDPTLPTADRALASFQAPAASFDYFSIGQTKDSRTERALRRVAEIMVDGPSLYHVANLSLGAALISKGVNCEGRWGLSRELEDLFEGGVLPVVSAGNDGNPGGCTVNSPGDSFVAVTVAGTKDGGRWQNPDPRDGSSVGDVSIDGRTLIDIAAPAKYDFDYYNDLAKPGPMPGYVLHAATTWAEVFQEPAIGGEFCNTLDDDGDGLVDEGFPNSDGPDPSDGTDPPDCAEDIADVVGTSFAAPAVAGAAVLYREFYLTKYSRLIDDPGIALVNLLVRGDRFGASSGIGYNVGFGAGNLEMWMTNTPALTPSWGWGTGRVCVSDGEEVTIPIRGSLPSDIEGLRVVAWWKDTPGKRDYIDLAVLENGAVAKQDAGNADVKKRVALSGSELTASAQYELRLFGDDIRGKDECGSSQEKMVYWAFLYADEVGF